MSRDGLMKHRGDRVRLRRGTVEWSRAEVAEMLREGVSIRDVADALGIDPRTVRQGLGEAGWDTRGRVVPKMPVVITRTPSGHRADYTDAACVQLVGMFDLADVHAQPCAAAVAACKRCTLRAECHRDAIADQADHTYRAGLRWFGGAPAGPSQSPRTQPAEMVVDESAVLRRLAGEHVGRTLTTGERLEVARRMRRLGFSDALITRTLRVSGHTWQRLAAELREDT